jgi:hypothetical protein
MLLEIGHRTKEGAGIHQGLASYIYRITMDALINHYLKPVASTLPLATDEIKKLHAF